MEIRTANFETLTKHYKTFVEGKKKIHEVKQGFLGKIEPLRKEMESIIQASNSNLIIDQKSQQERLERFRTLQEQAIGFDNDFKHEFRKMNDELNVKVYDELEVIISEWAIANKIDLVTGKMEVVYCNPAFEATEQILELLKEKELYLEYKEEETEKESV